MAATDGGTDWERVARHQLERRADEVAAGVEQSIRVLGARIGRDNVNRDDVVNARTSIEEAIYLVEDHLAPVVPDAEQGAKPAHYIRNDGAAAGHLGLTIEQVSDARYGASAEVTVDQLQALINGGAVVVETPGGITVQLQPASIVETNTGP